MANDWDYGWGAIDPAALLDRLAKRDRGRKKTATRRNGRSRAKQARKRTRAT